MVTSDGNGNTFESKLHWKELAIGLGILTVLWGAITFVFGLMYFPRDEGVQVRNDLARHVESAAILEGMQDKAIEDGKTKRETMAERLRRMELRQYRMAPKSVKRDIPIPNEEADDP